MRNFKEYFKRNSAIIIICSMLIVLLGVIVFLFGMTIAQENAHKEWYASLSAEEKAEGD